MMEAVTGRTGRQTGVASNAMQPWSECCSLLLSGTYARRDLQFESAFDVEAPSPTTLTFLGEKIAP